MRIIACLILVCVVLAIPVHGQALRTEILVEAEKSIGELNLLWLDFAQGGESSDPDYLKPLIPWIKPLNPRLIRTDSTFNYFTTAKVDASGQLVTDFSALDEWIGYIHEMGAKPLLCITYSPKDLFPGENNTPPNDLAVWEELVYQLVKHVNVERGYGVEYWQVWNEPNLEHFWEGSMDEYLELYAVTVRGALRVDPSIKIGGPAVAGSNQVWVEAFIDYALEHDIRLDFISWHDYRTPSEYYKQMARRTRGLLLDRGMDAELFITEWNYDAGTEPPNDDERGAAYAARSLHQMIDSPLDHSHFFELKDGWDWMEDRTYWGRWGLFTFLNDPKAVYYAFKSFSQMGTERVRLIGGTTSTNGFAAWNGDELTMMLYSCSPTDHWTGVDGYAAVNLTITGLPKGNVTWERFLVDGNHSNPVKQGHHSELQKVADLVTSTKDGVLETCVWLDKDSVSLIRIKPASPDARSKPLPPQIRVPDRQPEPSFACGRVSVSPTIDGDLSDWDMPAVEVASDDVSASIRFAWDDSAFYLGVEVKGSEFHQEQIGSQLWAGDSIQVGFDTLANAMPGEAYGGDDYEYGFALTPNGPVVWRLKCPAWKEDGPVDGVDLAVRRDDTQGITTYEIAIPWSELDPATPRVGAVMGVSMLINDVVPDGERRTLEWGEGIVVAKLPHTFNILGLVE